MKLTKVLATGVAGALLAGIAGVAMATSASAADFGPAVTGDILWFDAQSTGLLDSTLTSANQVDGSLQPDAVARPWKTLALSASCPAGTLTIQPYVHIPAPGPEIDWDAVSMAASVDTKDAQGRFYDSDPDQLADRMNKPQIRAYATAQGGTATLPYVVVCQGTAGAPLGHFTTPLTVHVTAPSPTTAITYSIPKASLPTRDGGWDSTGPVVTATTTDLMAAASGADLVLTANVAPSAAAGTVTFKEGATVLGSGSVSSGVATQTVTAPSAGDHAYTASFEPSDTAAFGPSSGSQTYTVVVGPNGQLTVTLTVPAAPVVDGALTFSVPTAAVALSGQRDTGNTRITATAQLGGITVNDTRRDGLLAGWKVNVQASDFTGAKGTLNAKYLGWTPALPTITKETAGTLAVQAGSGVTSALDDAKSTGLGASKTLAATTGTGRGTTALAAALNLAIPAATAEGSYTSTITVTLVSN
ncbi:Ig-like domain-containing protein [Cellulomonas sp. URHE0023]|uniref:Ig-like domain-containing protein n=1 Tax=Cellulomonas sp. URHE0023 TaxID=1380354 RepID=UPI000484EA8F|nr:Ig-like domain-containing protein [Cellulomonas sp. URHE0023]